MRETGAVGDDLEEDETRDRRALEAIIGRSLDDDEWAGRRHATPGTRVRVIQDPEWNGPRHTVFLGTIDGTMPPQLARNRLAHDGEREYSVTFDEPQLDADGDGAYRKAVIWERYLEVL